MEKIEKRWFKKWRKEFPEDLKKMEEDSQIPEKFKEDLDKVFEKGVKKIAKLFPIHAVGNPDPYPIKEALEFANKIEKENKESE